MCVTLCCLWGCTQAKIIGPSTCLQVKCLRQTDDMRTHTLEFSAVIAMICGSGGERKQNSVCQREDFPKQETLELSFE